MGCLLFKLDGFPGVLYSLYVFGTKYWYKCLPDPSNWFQQWLGSHCSAMRSLWKGSKTSSSVRLFEIWRLDTHCIGLAIAVLSLLEMWRRTTKNKLRRWWAQTTPSWCLFFYRCSINPRRIGVSWSDYRFVQEIAQRSRINVYFSVSIRATSRPSKDAAGLIDWTAALMYVPLTIPIVGMYRYYNDNAFCIYLDAFSQEFYRVFIFIKSVMTWRVKSMKIDQWVRFIIRYGFILLRFWMVATTEYERRRHRLLLWIYRACASWLLFIEISVVYPDWRHRGRPPLFVFPYHFTGLILLLLRGESAILFRNALILQFILGRWLSFQLFNKGTAFKSWWPLFFLLFFSMEIIFWKSEERCKKSWKKPSKTQRATIWFATSPI